MDGHLSCGRHLSRISICKAFTRLTTIDNEEHRRLTSAKIVATAQRQWVTRASGLRAFGDTMPTMRSRAFDAHFDKDKQPCTLANHTNFRSSSIGHEGISTS